MDFVTGLPRTPTGKDAIWVIVDRLTRSAHYLAIRVDFSLERLARLYINEIVRLNVHLYPLCLIETEDLCLNFGRACIRQWVLT